MKMFSAVKFWNNKNFIFKFKSKLIADVVIQKRIALPSEIQREGGCGLYPCKKSWGQMKECTSEIVLKVVYFLWSDDCFIGAAVILFSISFGAAKVNKFLRVVDDSRQRVVATFVWVWMRKPLVWDFE